MRNAHRLLWIVASVSLTAATAFAQNAAPPAAPARETPRPQDLEPGVDTSSPAQSPDKASSMPAATAAPSKPASPATRSTAAGAKPQIAAGAGAAPDPGAATAAKPGAKGKSLDRLELDTTQITGNRELPKVLYIVPWKRSDLGDLVGKPVNSLLDEVLTPVDRDVFQRENRYYRALTPGAAENDALSAQDSRATPVRSPTPTNSAPAAGSQGSATHPTNSTGSPIGSTGSGSAASPPRDEK